MRISDVLAALAMAAMLGAAAVAAVNDLECETDTSCARQCPQLDANCDGGPADQVSK